MSALRWVWENIWWILGGADLVLAVLYTIAGAPRIAFGQVISAAGCVLIAISRWFK